MASTETAPAFGPDFAELLARATVGTLTEAAATLRRVRAGLTAPAAVARVDARLEVLDLELALRADAAAPPAHDYRREERDDAVRMVCRCGKRSRWGTYAQLFAAADRHANETARGAR